MREHATARIAGCPCRTVLRRAGAGVGFSCSLERRRRWGDPRPSLRSPGADTERTLRRPFPQHSVLSAKQSSQCRSALPRPTVGGDMRCCDTAPTPCSVANPALDRAGARMRCGCPPRRRDASASHRPNAPHHRRHGPVPHPLVLNARISSAAGRAVSPSTLLERRSP
jgi:hypothetical protein